MNVPKSLSKYLKPDVLESHTAFVGKAKNIAQRMVNEYTMKQRAHEAANTQYNKTGTIDMSRIAQLYTSDDIFLKKTVVPSGQSHGLVIYIDWSGSMSNSVEQMAAQYLVTALFAKRAKIPFSVTLFTSTNIDGGNHELASSDYTEQDLIEIYYHIICFSSNIYTEARYGTLIPGYMRNVNYINVDNVPKDEIRLSSEMTRVFGMGGTPLYESKLEAYVKAVTLRNKHKLQNMTVLFITDGLGAALSDENYKQVNSVVCPFTSRRFAVADFPPTHPTLSVDWESWAITRPINAMYTSQGIKIMNLFIADGPSYIKRGVYNMTRPWVVEYDNVAKVFRETKSTEVHDFGKILGYTRYLAASRRAFPSVTSIDTEIEDVNPNTKGKASLQQRFMKTRTGTQALSKVCSIIVDEICQDFKI